jgi:hypothetical protein
VSAILSHCGQYRYLLSRDGDLTAMRAPAVFIMLDPSTADAALDDPTIRRRRSFAQSWGCNGIRVVNLYALRSTNPKALWTYDDPVGSENDHWLEHIALSSSEVVCAWGANAKLERVERVASRLIAARVALKCLGMTKQLAPRHPLYVPGAEPLVAWAPPEKTSINKLLADQETALGKPTLGVRANA